MAADGPTADSDNDLGGPNNRYNANNDFSALEQDRFLPIANVSRIMKKALPTKAKISKDTKEGQGGASEMRES